MCQKKISETLGALDDKIESNTDKISILESVAEMHYVKYFVEKQNGSIGVLSDLGNVVGGGTPSKSKSEYYVNDGIAWLTPKDLSIQKSKFMHHGKLDISEVGYSNSSAKIMPAGTVLFSSRAPIGYVAIATGELCTNQGFKSLVPNPEIGTPFVYYTLKKLVPTTESLAGGSTFKEISGAAMKKVPCMLPLKSDLMEFNALCEPLFALQENLEKQNYKLATLRDALLPELMSGRIRVPQAQEAIAEVIPEEDDEHASKTSRG